MPRARDLIVQLTAFALLISAGVFLASPGVVAQDAPDAGQKKEASPNQPAAETATSLEDFIVPEGKDPAKLQEFLTGLMETPLEDQSRAGIRAHFGKLHSLSEEVYNRDVDDETSLLAVQIMAGCLDLMEQYGDRTAAERKAKLVEQLKKHQRPALATQGRLLDVRGQISQMNPEDKASVKQVIDQVTQTLKDKPLTLDHGRLAYTVVSVLEQLGDPKHVEMAAQAFAGPLRGSDDPQLSGLADTLEGTARRLNLKGNPLKLTGTTVTGEEFNIDQWKGKVVVVDFWATWCGPCVAELPNLQKLYETNKDKGLEVVGISLDESRPQLEEFLRKKEVKWPTLFTEAQAGEAWDNPIATYYGVSAIPTVILVGRDGKVVATDLYGEQLAEAVEQLLKAE